MLPNNYTLIYDVCKWVQLFIIMASRCSNHFSILYRYSSQFAKSFLFYFNTLNITETGAVWKTEIIDNPIIDYHEPIDYFQLNTGWLSASILFLNSDNLLILILIFFIMVILSTENAPLIKEKWAWKLRGSLTL